MPATSRDARSRAIVVFLIPISAALLWSWATAGAGQADDKPKDADKTKGKPLFDGKSLTGWTATNFGGEGDVTVEGGAIVMDQGGNMTGITYARDDFPRIDYEVTIEGKKLKGNDFFCTTTFPVGDSFCSLVVGGWAGSTVGLSSIDGKDASENDTRSLHKFKLDQWYKVRIRVSQARIEAWIDDKQVVNQATKGKKISIRAECDACKPFGITTWRTTGAVRDIRVRLLTDEEKKAAVGLADLPANTWVPIRPITQQPASEEENGQWMNVGWNKLVYDPDGKRVLFYDRWFDKKHGGTTIYGNCLFSFDPETSRLTPLLIDGWVKRGTPNGGYRTEPLPDVPVTTPCSRHVYHGFDYVPDLKAVFLCNGANQTAQIDGKLRGHELCTDTWRYDIEKKTWTKLAPKEHPRNDLEDGMAYCPDTKSIVYAGHGKLWVLDLAAGQWRKAKNDLPRSHMGMTVFYDPPRKRMLLAGGGAYNKWQTKAGGFNTLYAFDPKTEVISKLADCPTALCRGALAYDSKRDLFIVAVSLKGDGVEQPSGMFVYDPRKDVWQELKSTNAMPMEKGWMPLCYDAAHDCLIGMVGTTFYAFRYVPTK